MYFIEKFFNKLVQHFVHPIRLLKILALQIFIGLGPGVMI